MKRPVRRVLWVLVFVLAVSVAAGVVYTHREEETVGGSVIVLNYADVDFYPSVGSLDDKGLLSGSAGYPVGPRAGGGKGGLLRIDSRTLAPGYSNGGAVSLGRLA